MVILEREMEPFKCVTASGPVKVSPGLGMKTERTELQGTFWVFAWPELIPWKHKIVPLLSPCGGKGWKVGDLWAVDEEGQLLIIENKRVRNRESPFKKFEQHGIPAVDELRSDWLTSLEQEMIFRQLYADGLGPEMPPRSAHGIGRGVLDTSRGRIECRRYRHVYCQRLAPDFDSGVYKQRAELYLSRYAAQQEPPHYFGLYTLFENDKIPQCVDDHGLLTHARKQNVHAFAVQRFPESRYYPDECQICSYRVRVRQKHSTAS
jgi:hypothetical protein